MAQVRKRRPILKLKNLIPSEFEECKAFWAYCQTVLRLGKKIVKHCNEGMRDDWYTKALINIGLTPGLLDYQFWISNEKYHGLWIEMKRRDQRNKKKDNDQEEMIALLNKNGHYATYAYGWEDAIRIYTEYVNNKL